MSSPAFYALDRVTFNPYTQHRMYRMIIICIKNALIVINFGFSFNRVDFSHLSRSIFHFHYEFSINAVINKFSKRKKRQKTFGFMRSNEPMSFTTVRTLSVYIITRNIHGSVYICSYRTIDTLYNNFSTFFVFPEIF